MTRHLRFILRFVVFVLAAVPVVAETAPTSAPSVSSSVEMARASQASGSFAEAFRILKGSAGSELSAADRSLLSDALTELSVAEYKLRNYGNAAEAVREGLRLLPTNRTATELFLTLKREKIIATTELPAQASVEENPPEPTDGRTDILSALKRSEEQQARLMERLDAGTAELTQALASSDRLGSAVNREFSASLNTVSKRQAELLEQTRLVARAGEDRARAIAELGEAYATRSAFPSWVPPALGMVAFLLLVTIALNAYHLSVTLRSRPVALARSELFSALVPVLPAPTVAETALAVVRTNGATSVSPHGEIARCLESIADLERPMNRDTRAMQWALLLHDRLDVALDGKDMSPLTARLGKLVAKRLGLPRLECEAIYRYALVHDLGYLLLDQERLTHACAAHDLSTEDLSYIRSHVAAGAAFLEELGSSVVPPLFTAVRSHHERMDGSGYPAGLSCSQIPLVARIIGVCETYLALQTPRRYRVALDPQGALNVIARVEREKFDPEVVRALTSLTRKED